MSDGHQFTLLIKYSISVSDLSLRYTGSAYGYWQVTSQATGVTALKSVSRVCC